MMPQQIANGFSWAWHNGADIISNSWGGCAPSSIIDNAIDSVLIHGRNGKGGIVVFAAGNDNSTIKYPGNSNPDILVVGAISPCGERKSPTSCDGENWGACYGTLLDIVAPGVLIPTTDRQGNNGYNYDTKPDDYSNCDYTQWFNGTSAACPHVSGVAALVLSVNPSLTGLQVRNIIESTAQKVGGYNYQPTFGRPNGTWHEEMGYGLVDAYAAVLATLETICYSDLPIVHGTITQNTTWNTDVHATGTVTVQKGVTLTITSQVKCEENVSITVQDGGKLVINGGKLTSACPDKLWQGIIVLGNKNQPQFPLYQGTVELKSGATIEHALCAISAAPAGYDNFTGGIINADSAIFRNNVLAIEYRPYENKNASGAVIDNIGKFTNCTFTVDNISRFIANGKTFRQHVSMWEVRGVTFEGCTFENNIGVLIGRLPIPVYHGIYTLDAGFKVKNYCKPGGSTGVDCPCLYTHTTPTTFTSSTNKGFTVGILSENTGQPYYIHIDQSEFQHLTTGVNMNDQTNYRLTRCDFINNNTGLSSFNSSGYKIEANDFSAPAFSATGIVMNNSGIAENKIYKNDFSNLNKGISAQAVNSSPFQIIQGLQFLSNTFTNNKYDIYLESNAIIRAHQGNPASGADNKFIGTSTSSISSQGSQPQAITYYHSPGGNKTPINPTSNVTVIGNARPGPTSSTLCDVLTRIEILSDSLEQYKSMQQQYDDLLAQLKDNPELLQELLLLSDAMRELSDHAISRILGDSILYLENLKPWYEAVRTPVAKYSLAEVHFYEKNYDQAEMMLNKIPDMFEYSESEMTEHNNYMRFYNFKKQLQLADRNWTQLDETEIAYLQTIAEATNGRSASMAQGVLCFFFDICYEDKIEEGEEGGEVIPPTKNMATETQLSDNQNQNLDYELTLYPNPTSSEMTVVLNNPAVKIVAMELYDLFGKKVHQQTVNQSYSTLKMSELEQGIYILKVWLNQGDVVMRKVVRQ